MVLLCQANPLHQNYAQSMRRRPNQYDDNEQQMPQDMHDEPQMFVNPMARGGY